MMISCDCTLLLPHPALSKGEGSEKQALDLENQKVLSFGEDLGEANTYPFFFS